MNTRVFRPRSKTGIALAIYLLSLISLGFLARAQVSAFQLIPNSRTASSLQR